MKKLNEMNNKSKLLKEEIIKSKIEDNYQVQLTDYIYLQNKLESIKNLLIHKPQLSTLDYTKLNKFYNFSKSIIMPKKFNNNDEIDIIKQKTTHKKNSNDNFDKKLYLSNPILKKLFLSIGEDNMKNNNNDNIIPNSRNKSAFIRYNPNLNNKNGMKNLKTIYANFRPKNDLYKLPKQIKNKFIYNLTDIQNNTIKKKYQVNEKLSKFDKYASYFLRGLSLSEEQNMFYQKCKKIDLSANEDQKNKKKYGNLNTFEFKRKNLMLKTRTARTLLKKKNNIRKNEMNFIQNYNRNLFKYSLKDLLKTNNPIKIIL